jgi:hypothetical protein
LAVSCWSSTKRRKGLARLIYASRFDRLGGDFDETVRTILLKSIQNNRLAAVTGFLLAGEGRFLQWLEGPAVRSRRDLRTDRQRIRATPTS